MKSQPIYMGMNPQKFTQFYRENRQKILSGGHARDVRAEVARQQAAAREEQIAADPQGHALQQLIARRDQLRREGRKTDVYDQSISRIEAELAAEAKRKAFRETTVFASTMEVALLDRALVETHDPDSLTAVDAAIELYRSDHQNRDRLYGELARLSKTASLNEFRARREAEHASAKAALELARADLARAEAQNETNKQLAAAAQLEAHRNAD